MRPPKFIPTCDSILTPNVASTLQWKRHRIRRVAWYAKDDFNVNPTSSLSCHVSCADFFRRRALFLPLTRRPATGIVGRLPHRGFVVCCNGGMFVRLTDCVSCAIRRARSFVCTIACVHDRGRAVPVAVVHGRRAVVFVSPSCGCDTPMDASVCNGLCGVCVVSICYLTG